MFVALHEVAHIANGDMVTMTLVQGVVNAFVMFFSSIITNIISNAMRRDDDDGEGFGGFFLRQFIYTIVSSLIGLFLFGESLSGESVIGLLLIASGIYVLNSAQGA